MTLPERVRAVCGDDPSCGVVAVSGGADSVALLRAVVDVVAPGRLVVGHVNHQLRGNESDGDELFVESLAGTLGVSCRTVRVHLPSGENQEGAARRARYDWLRRVAEEVGASWVATGHTADDQAETVLHRLIRGSGVRGLRGIAVRKRLRDKVSVIRPLLTSTRAEVIDYLNGLAQPYRTDASNADGRFTRNRIRHEVLPLLRTFNPAVVAALNRLANQANELDAQLTALAADLLRQAERPRAGEVLVVDAGVLATFGESRIRAVLRVLWDREHWPTAGMSYAHWCRAAGIALGHGPAADFPGGVHLRREGDVMQLRQQA